jgi:AraC-like DNA-binding protein
VLAFMMIIFGYYVSGDGGMFYEYTVQVFGLFLVFYLLWRVETLSDLSIPLAQSFPANETDTEDIEDNTFSPTIHEKIGELLQQHCIDTQFYLQHDLTLPQLAQIIGTNRRYLSQYFSSQDTNYNTYINDLRINHFVSLYREAIAAKRSATAQQLANECGYRSYSTFTLAFKQRMGQSVTAWMRDSGE